MREFLAAELPRVRLKHLDQKGRARWGAAERQSKEIEETTAQVLQVSRSIAKAGFYSGSFPFDDNASWEKNAATLRNLHALRERVRALEKKSP